MGTIITIGRNKGGRLLRKKRLQKKACKSITAFWREK